MHTFCILRAETPDWYELLQFQLAVGIIFRWHLQPVPHRFIAIVLNFPTMLQWWNPTVEEQAIDRAHRIGQTRTVHVTRITIAGK